MDATTGGPGGTRKGLLERLASGPVICAEGYLFECERRGYLQAGAFVPEVVLEHPEVIVQLHRDFVHAGSDVVEAFTYYAHREKLRVIGREDVLEPMNRQALALAKQVADESGALFAGDLANTNVFTDGEESRRVVRAMFEEQATWAAEAGADFIIAETFGSGREAILACEVIKDAGLPAVVTFSPDPVRGTDEGWTPAETCKRLEDAGADVVGLNCGFGPATMYPYLAGIIASVSVPVAALPVPYRTHHAEAMFQMLSDPRLGVRAFPVALDPFTCNRYEIAEFTTLAAALGVRYFGLCCGAAPHHVRAMAEALGRRPPASRYSANLTKHYFYSQEARQYEPAAELLAIRDPRHDVLFEPITIGPKVLRNRFYQVPHCTGFGTEKPWSQAAFRGMKAEGGWAGVCTEYAPISQDSDTMPLVSSRFWDDADAENLALMCSAVHRHGSLAGIELHHGGVMALPKESRWPAIGPSQISNAMYPDGTAPKEMDAGDIRRVQQDWVAAAVRARDVGFDIVYVYGAHSFLLLQFLSPMLNRRTDAYGGALGNRARLWLETLELVRAAVGSDCAVAARFAVEALGPWGVSTAEGLGFVQMADHLVDLWDITVGAVAGMARIDSAASRFFAEGYELEWTHEVRQVTDKPLVGVGRFTNPDTMAALVRSRELDVIGAARPSIADPFLPVKIEEGRYDEIRECIGCNFCYSRAEYSGHLGCTQNAAAGEEHRRGWHPEVFTRATNADRDVLVVGAGPAGMECAIVLAKRGFPRVHLVEAGSEIGGTARWVPKLPGLGEWGRVLGWRTVQLHKLRKSVEVVTGVTIGLEQALAYGAELVIVATGSIWASDGLSGVTFGPIAGADAGEPWVLTPEQIMLEGKRPTGRSVLVYDCEGYFMGAGLAELLREEGHEVVLATPHEQIAPVCFETLESHRLRRRLHEIGVEMTTEISLESVQPGLALGVGPYGTPVRLVTDSIVLVTQRISRDGLYRELQSQPEAVLRSSGIEGVYRAGDCVAPRVLGDAIFDGHRLGREIDSADPALPLAYLRERPLAARP